MTRSPSPFSSFLGQPYTLVPLAGSPSSSTGRRQLRHASSSVRIRSLLSHMGKFKRKAQSKVASSIQSASTPSLLSRKRSRREATPTPYSERVDTDWALDYLESSTTGSEVISESFDPVIREVHAEWQQLAQSLQSDQRNCLQGAVCLGITEPLHNHFREGISLKPVICLCNRFIQRRLAWVKPMLVHAVFHRLGSF